MQTVISGLSILMLAGLIGCGSAGGGGNGGGNGNGGNDTSSSDECGGDRGDGNLGDVCREDCDCASSYTCYTDDYAEQCCAQDLNDLENGAWGVDCDGVQ